MYKYGYGYGVQPTINQLGANANPLPAWALLPYFALPAAGVDLVVGYAVTLYGNTLTNLPIDNDLTVEYTCGIGTQSGNNLVLNPTTAGTYPCTIVFKNNGTTFETKTINLNVSAVANRAVTAMLVGDSLVFMGHVENATAINAVLPLVTFVGRQGTAVKHEGISGYSYESFVTNPASPFIKAGALNIAAYFIDNGVTVPDYVHFRLGVNQCYGASNIGFSEALRTAILTGEVAFAKILVDAFLAFNPALKIIIALPSICENTGAGWAANYDEAVYLQDVYIKSVHRLWGLLITQFDGYNTRVSLSNESIFLDRNDGYPKTAGVHNNGVHPAASGYTQLGTGMALTVNAINQYIPTGLTLSLISGGVKIDWTDNSGGTFETEIWGKNDSDAYALLYTIAAGTVTKSETIAAVDLRYYKLRGKNGTYFTAFTSEASIAMLGAELITNGNFAAWTGDNPDGWSVTEAGADVVTESAGRCRFLTTGANIQALQSKLTVNNTYRVSVNCYAVTAGRLYLLFQNPAILIETTGIKTFVGVANSVDLILKRFGGSTDVTIDDVSAKRLLMP